MSDLLSQIVVLKEEAAAQDQEIFHLREEIKSLKVQGSCNRVPEPIHAPTIPPLSTQMTTPGKLGARVRNIEERFENFGLSLERRIAKQITDLFAKKLHPHPQSVHPERKSRVENAPPRDNMDVDTAPSAPQTPKLGDTTLNLELQRGQIEKDLKIPKNAQHTPTTRAVYSKYTGQKLLLKNCSLVDSDHGPYTGFPKPDEQLGLSARTLERSGPYFELHRVEGVLVYKQLKTVENNPNPPPGKFSVALDRSGGYAKYKVGYGYISLDSIYLKDSNGASLYLNSGELSSKIKNAMPDQFAQANRRRNRGRHHHNRRGRGGNWYNQRGNKFF